MMQPLTTNRRLESVSAAIALAAYLLIGPIWVQQQISPDAPSQGPCVMLVQLGLLLTIYMMLNRLIFRINPVIENCGNGSRVIIGECVSVIILICSGFALYLEWSHRLVAAELVIAATECAMICVLICASRRASSDLRIRATLIHECASLTAILWILYVCRFPTWATNPSLAAPMLVGCLTPIHGWYVVESFLAQHPEQSQKADSRVNENDCQ